MSAKGVIRELAHMFDEQDDRAFDLMSWMPAYYYFVKYGGYAPETPDVAWVLWYVTELIQYINGHTVSEEFMDFMDMDKWDEIPHPLTDEIPEVVHKDWNADQEDQARLFINRYKAMNERYRP